jgi:hypothetical protein
VPSSRTAERAGTGSPTGEVVGSPPAQAGGRLEMQKQNTNLAARIPDPSVPRARLDWASAELRLFDAASGGILLHQEEAYLVRGRPVTTAAWAWQQLSVGKKATQDCASAAEVYVENLSLQAVWFDPSWSRIWRSRPGNCA